MRYLVQKYPDATAYDARNPSKPAQKIADLTLDDYCVAKVTEDIGETSNIRVKQAIGGFLINSYYNLAIGEDDQGIGYSLLAEKIWARYQTETSRNKGQIDRIGLPPLDDLKKDALNQFDQTYNPILVAQLHTKLGLPPPAIAPAASTTNAPAAPPTPGSSPKP
jgi:hypothetical protein